LQLSLGVRRTRFTTRRVNDIVFGIVERGGAFFLLKTIGVEDADGYLRFFGRTIDKASN